MTPLLGQQGLPTHHRRGKLWRNEIQVLVGTTNTKLLGPNPRRFAVMFGTPIGTAGGGGIQPTNGTVSGHAISTAATGSVLTYNCPANTTALLNAAQYSLIGGTAPQLRTLYIPNGGSQQFLGPVMAAGTILQINSVLSAGDQVVLNCSAAGAGSTVDAQLFVEQFPAAAGGGTDNTVFISTVGAATVNGGMPLHPGITPFVLLSEHIGQAIREDIFGIASNTAVTLTIWDIFEVDCPCQD